MVAEPEGRNVVWGLVGARLLCFFFRPAMAAAATAVPVPDGSDDELVDPWDQPAQDPWAAPPPGGPSQWETGSSAVDASLQGASWGSTPQSAFEIASGQGRGPFVASQGQWFPPPGFALVLPPGWPPAVPGLSNVYAGHPGPQLGGPPPWGMWPGGPWGMPPPMAMASTSPSGWVHLGSSTGAPTAVDPSGAGGPGVPPASPEGPTSRRHRLPLRRLLLRRLLLLCLGAGPWQSSTAVTLEIILRAVRRPQT